MELGSNFELNQDDPTDYSAAISDCLVAFDHVRAQMMDTQLEIDCLKAQTQAILARLNTGQSRVEGDAGTGCDHDGIISNRR